MLRNPALKFMYLSLIIEIHQTFYMNRKLSLDLHQQEAFRRMRALIERYTSNSVISSRLRASFSSLASSFSTSPVY